MGLWLLILGSRLALACDTPCKEPSVEQALSSATLVFYGTVVEKKERPLYDVVTFDVTTQWKGAPVKSAVLTVYGDDCDPMAGLLTGGDQALVFAAPAVGDGRRTGEHGELSTGFCRGSVKFMAYDKGPPRYAELTALAAGKKPSAAAKAPGKPRRPKRKKDSR